MIRLARTDFGMQEGNGQDCIYCYVKDHQAEIAELKTAIRNPFWFENKATEMKAEIAELVAFITELYESEFVSLTPAQEHTYQDIINKQQEK